MPAQRVISEVLGKNEKPARNCILPVRSRSWFRRALWVAACLSVTTWLSAMEPPVIKSATWEPPYIDLHLPLKVSSTLRLKLGRQARIRLCVVGPDGRRLKTLISDAVWEKGSHTVAWDGSDDAGLKVPSEAYTPSLSEFRQGGWVALYEPNAANHGLSLEVKGLQWNPAEGVLLLSVPEPARLRVWVIHGDDGLMLASLRDMEPVEKGMIAIRWKGRDSRTGQDVKEWGGIGFFCKGYSLPETHLVVNNGDPRAYLARRSQYPVQPSSVPRSYPDSGPLYRLEYADQKELVFTAELDGDSLIVHPDSNTLRILASGSSSARVFCKDGTWKQYDLTPGPKRPGTYSAKLDNPGAYKAKDLALLLGTARDQFGYWSIRGLTSGSARSGR